ncbi:pantothenate synthetase [Bradyrhizobium sp. USDA 3650]
MQTVTTLVELRHVLARDRGDKRVGFVPTMGYLHDGHLALLKASQSQCDVTITSIFVNPTQFGANEDLSTYPRDFLRDKKLCLEAGVAIVFVPDVQEVYATHFETFVEPGELAKPSAERSGLGTFAASQLSSASSSIWCSRMLRSSDRRIFSSVLSCVAWRLISTFRSRSSPYQRCGKLMGSQ